MFDLKNDKMIGIKRLNDGSLELHIYKYLRDDILPETYLLDWCRDQYVFTDDDCGNGGLLNFPKKHLPSGHRQSIKAKRYWKEAWGFDYMGKLITKTRKGKHVSFDINTLYKTISRYFFDKELIKMAKEINKTWESYELTNDPSCDILETYIRFAHELEKYLRFRNANANETLAVAVPEMKSKNYEYFKFIKDHEYIYGVKKLDDGSSVITKLHMTEAENCDSVYLIDIKDERDSRCFLKWHEPIRDMKWFLSYDCTDTVYYNTIDEALEYIMNNLDTRFCIKTNSDAKAFLSCTKDFFQKEYKYADITKELAAFDSWMEVVEEGKPFVAEAMSNTLRSAFDSLMEKSNQETYEHDSKIIATDVKQYDDGYFIGNLTEEGKKFMEETVANILDSASDAAKIEIKDSGNRREFESGAVRDMSEGKGRMDLLPWSAIMEVSKHCENGAKKYGEHNVDKGIPTHSLCDSAARHLAKYLAGWDDEPHLLAAAWNLLWAIEMTITHPECVDTPFVVPSRILSERKEH